MDNGKKDLETKILKLTQKILIVSQRLVKFRCAIHCHLISSYQY
jgi:hypothetical protein